MNKLLTIKPLEALAWIVGIGLAMAAFIAGMLWLGTQPNAWWVR